MTPSGVDDDAAAVRLRKGKTRNAAFSFALAAMILLVTTIVSEARSGNIKSVGDALFAFSIAAIAVFVFWLIDNWNKR